MQIGYSIVKLLLRMLGKLPLGVHYAFAKVIAFLLRDILHYRRNVVMINLSRSFPDKKYKDIEKICKEFYNHLANIFVEAIWFGASDKERLEKQNLIRFEGIEEVFKANESAGVIAMASHCGNWELFGTIPVCHGTSFNMTSSGAKVVYKALRSKFWDRFFAENRCAPLDSTDYMIESSNVLRYAVQHRHDKPIFVFPTDQSPYRNATVHRVNDFMHQRTITMTGGAALARSLHMSVFFMGMKVESKGHYVMSFEKICDDGSNFTPEQIMDMYYEKLQKHIEEQPWNYLWTHKRWKNNEEDFKE